MTARSIACCSAPTKGKNREKACAGCLPTRVRTSNRKGQANRLDGHKQIGRRANTYPFFVSVGNTGQSLMLDEG
jgi:hypothetical protein